MTGRATLLVPPKELTLLVTAAQVAGVRVALSCRANGTAETQERITLLDPGPMESVTGEIITEKMPALVANPPGAMTEIGPVDAPTGTVAVICVPDSTENDALVPLNRTDDADENALPVNLTLVATLPDPGENDVIAGGVAPSSLAR